MDYFKIKSETQESFKNESIRNIMIALVLTKVVRFLYNGGIRMVLVCFAGILSLYLSIISGNYILIPICIGLSLLISHFLIKDLNITDEAKEQNIIHDTLIEILENKKLDSKEKINR